MIISTISAVDHDNTKFFIFFINNKQKYKIQEKYGINTGITFAVRKTTSEYILLTCVGASEASSQLKGIHITNTKLIK